MTSLISEIDQFCAAQEPPMPESRFGREALGDPAFVGRLRRRRHLPRNATIERIRAFIARPRPIVACRCGHDDICSGIACATETLGLAA